MARAARRDAAFHAAIALFVERGYDGTTMDAIAERAGASRASVFNYFARKPEILAEWSARRRAAVDSLTREGGAAGLRPRLIDYMDAWATVNERTRAETVACGPASLRETDLLTNSGMSHELTLLLEHAAAAGELRPGLDAPLAAISLAAAYFAVLGRWILAEGPLPDLHGELRALAQLFLHGLLA